MPFSDVIAAQARGPDRPKTASALLLHPIASDPHASGSVSDADWASEHARVNRFYVGGVQDFFNSTALTLEQLFGFKGDAPDAAKDAGWPDMPDTPPVTAKLLRGEWGAISKQQYYDVIGARCVNFAKAALFIMSCDLACQRADLPSVYTYMAIIPACWHVDGFNTTYVMEQIKYDPLFITRLLQFTGQGVQSTVHELASGHTVTYDTALKTKEFCASRAPVGFVRHRKKASVLGAKRAAPSEEVSR